MHILFITTSNLATNPRTLKEIYLALEQGMKVTLLCFSFDNWSKDINEKIKNDLGKKINYIELPGNRKPFLPWLKSTLIFESAGMMTKMFIQSSYWLSIRSNKRSWLVMKYLKGLKISPDLVVAHNIGSMYPAMVFAKKKGCGLGVDLEDYHPGETNNKSVSGQIKGLLQNVLPHADYITAASSLILEESLKDAQLNCPTETVLNYSGKDEFEEPDPRIGGPMRLIWFSQNVSFNRGLEQVIPIIESLDGVELDLFGNCNSVFYELYIKGKKNTAVYEALSQKELHKVLSEYDAGLAIEPGKDRNNELAVSNKMLAYFQAGLYIIASDTPAQMEFLKENPHSGLVLSLKESNLRERITAIIASKDSIRRTKAERFRNAQQYNWKSESEKLLKLWERVGRCLDAE